MANKQNLAKQKVGRRKKKVLLDKNVIHQDKIVDSRQLSSDKPILIDLNCSTKAVTPVAIRKSNILQLSNGGALVADEGILPS
uniref:Uncharacterized protein n=1 Tax=Romanomermis culicivorax TaxID=13658 RepID=A0A915KLL2_ROMCU